MKKLGLIIAALALVLGLSQCKKPNMPTINGTQYVVLKASFDNGNSKIAEDELGGIKWAVGDIITVCKDGEPLNPGTLTCQNEDGTFTGEIAKTTGDITFTFGTQCFTEQTGTLNAAISLSSGEVAYNPSGSYTDVTMDMPYAVLKLDLSYLGSESESGCLVTITDGETTVASVKNVSNNTNNTYYVAMPANSEETTYIFTGNGEKKVYMSWTLDNNKFYTSKYGTTGKEIAVRPVFTVHKTNDKKVEFAPGNLYYDGKDFRFEANQWNYQATWDATHVSHFKWGNADEAVSDNEDGPTSGEFFAASEVTVSGDSHTDWFTLSCDEFNNLFGLTDATSARENAGNLWDGRTVSSMYGLVILPDNAASAMDNVNTIDDLATYGAIFLPAPGYRNGTVIANNGIWGAYWTSTPFVQYSYAIGFLQNNDSELSMAYSQRNFGGAIRLARVIE